MNGISLRDTPISFKMKSGMPAQFSRGLARPK
jgi:hypothetical protein